VKIDVEGHQREVLDGFGEYRGAPKVIVIEDGDQPGVRQWMWDAGYAGPFFVHFKRCHLSEDRQARPEDPVYVSQQFLSVLCGTHAHDGAFGFGEFLEGSAASDARGVVEWQ